LNFKNIDPAIDYVNIDWLSGFPIICNLAEEKMYAPMKECIELFEQNYKCLFKKMYNTPFTRQLSKFIQTVKSEKCKKIPSSTYKKDPEITTEKCKKTLPSTHKKDPEITTNDILLEFNGMLPSEEVD